jgi:hypothetical protein
MISSAFGSWLYMIPGHHYFFTTPVETIKVQTQSIAFIVLRVSISLFLGEEGSSHPTLNTNYAVQPEVKQVRRTHMHVIAMEVDLLAVTRRSINILEGLCYTVFTLAL